MKRTIRRAILVVGLILLVAVGLVQLWPQTSLSLDVDRG